MWIWNCFGLLCFRANILTDVDNVTRCKSQFDHLMFRFQAMLDLADWLGKVDWMLQRVGLGWVSKKWPISNSAWAHHAKMKTDPYYQRQKCSPVTVVSGDINVKVLSEKETVSETECAVDRSDLGFLSNCMSPPSSSSSSTAAAATVIISHNGNEVNTFAGGVQRHTTARRQPTFELAGGSVTLQGISCGCD